MNKSTTIAVAILSGVSGQCACVAHALSPSLHGIALIFCM